MPNAVLRRFVAPALVGAAALAVITPAASAAEAKIPGQLTVKSYTAYLKAQKTPEAKQTLAKFGKLSATQKTRFVTHLQNRKIYLALNKQTKGTLGNPQHGVTPYNADVRFVTDVTSLVSKDTKHTTKLTFSVREEIFKIPVTTETLTFQYQIPKKGVVAFKGTARATNVNAAISITGGRVKPQIKGAIGHASTTWTASPRVTSFGKKAVKEQSAWAGSGYWSAKLANA